MRVARRSHDSRNAFTLVELLVTISIIVVLISLLMPMLSKGREAANQAKCMSNLHQIGLGMQGYAQNNDDCLPGDLHYIGSVAYAIWPTRIRPYVSNNQAIFYCPDQPDSYIWNVTPSGRTFVKEPATQIMYPGGYRKGEELLNCATIAFSYGYNDWGCSYNQGAGTTDYDQRGLGGDIDTAGWGLGPVHERRRSKIVNPAECICVTDKTSQFTYDFNVDPKDPTECPAAIHSNGCNVLWVDGHVDWMTEQSVCAFDVRTKIVYGIGSPQWTPIARLWNTDQRD